MKTSSAKAKGRRCSTEVQQLLLKYVPTLDGHILVTSSGATGPDLILSPLAKQFYPIVPECKNQEKLNVWDALEQAQSHCGPNTGTDMPVLFFRRNRSKLYVALEAERLISLLSLQTRAEVSTGWD